MRTSDFDYQLPSERIAQQPVPRGTSRLLVVGRSGEERHRQIGDLPEILREGDLLVVNDTRVLPARLFGRGTGGGRVELLLVERLETGRWLCLTRPGRRTRPGAKITLERGIGAQVQAVRDDGRREVRFSEPVSGFLEALGHVPLPPYIRRQDHEEDRERYQTVYAERPGAIAAPTAGLHFEAELLDALAAGGVEIRRLTLHVGIGTFRPVAVERVEEHRMDAEHYEIGEETRRAVEAARRDERRVVAVGTTVVRALEAAVLAGGGELAAGAGSTDLFITPGFTFRVVDALLTNFHLPRSTLLMLVCAFAGREPVLAAYREAVERGYRFYSYGDAMLLERRQA